MHRKLTQGEKSCAASGTQSCIRIVPGFSVDVLSTEISLPYGIKP